LAALEKLNPLVKRLVLNVLDGAETRGLGRERRAATGRHNDRRAPLHQFSRQLRQALEAALRPARLDGDVSAFDIASFFETLAKASVR
jgi:hypothetical protein